MNNNNKDTLCDSCIKIKDCQFNKYNKKKNIEVLICKNYIRKKENENKS